MSAILRSHLEKFISVNDKTFLEIISFFEPASYHKKENLMNTGDVCRYHYLVEKGCIRKFFLKDSGVEQTTEFALEHWWMTDNFAFEQQRESDFSIQAVESTEVLKITFENRETLMKEVPEMEHYFRMVYQRAYAAAERRIRYLYEYSREELYLHFAENFPEFLQRIPQYLLASFLGFTPEYLSEIRSKFRS